VDQLLESDDDESSKSPRLLGSIINGADIAVKFRNDVDEWEMPVGTIGDGAIEVRSSRLPQHSKPNTSRSVTGGHSKSN